MADRDEITTEIEALTTHCRPPLMDVDARMLWLRDWCEDLASYPIEAIRKACRQYRMGGSAKFPTPGQLMPLVQSHMPSESHGRTEVWRPLTDEEYRGLTVRQKHRHQLILASEAGGKAGPMFRNAGGTPGKPKGEHLTPADMPPAWSHWIRVRDGHMAEAKRLREIMNQPAYPALEQA